MLKRYVFKGTLGYRKLSYRYPPCKEAKQERETDIISSKNDDNNAESTSIQEKVIFGSIFERMQKKEEIMNRNMSKLLSSKKRGNELKITFGNDINPSDLNLVKFLKGEADKQREEKGNIMYNLFVNLEETLRKNKKNTLAKSDILGMNIDTKVQKPSLEIDFDRLESEERHKAALNNVMKPYINQLSTEINNDFDILEKIKDLMTLFLHRDRKQDLLLRKSPIEIIAHIQKHCSNTLRQLPEPYAVTLPYTVVKLLSDPQFEIPSDRKYTILMYVYQECKANVDLSLYLNLCTIDFYNLLLQLTWENFNEIYRLREITNEMEINGITGDIYTVELLDKIVNDLRTMNDNVLDEEDLDKMKKNALTIGVVWSKETETDLHLIENYVKNLKKALTASN
ncbi:hypothetical protein KAFR_0F02100 [Kazachstania africana CBS 2517]|uniref:Mtf2-like C-terminal domain-containing protein n=1 Tax=Kazachstania africana (strain ATCC 22294 / BCRC 22015 / CBS 2517 / CECT 1963 / NBRC 1671 / NRRL Y-8276) TaxID=1071382 RepID=H2AWQ7_KAZAF|nr:hypothetical protein KAFR_0F02100 [Kazachstania africana CBS 2517]CCF58807.1 hypothetical protein KAFR_0F02100 [Kazachstania africana CBS 2517]